MLRYTLGVRHASTAVDTKAYSKTLRLPKTTFPLRRDPIQSKELFQKKTTESLYRWQWDNATGPLWVSHDGPPYANGALHMGHALNKIIKDIINRYRVSRGHRVNYIPGWDCHGLPIENKALKDIGKDLSSVSPATIREVAGKTARAQAQRQRKEFESFGIMADWSQETTYRTLDSSYVNRQLRIFQKMVEKGLIYRRYKPVHYSPSSRSALAEAELTYEDGHVSHSVYVSFSLDNDKSRQTSMALDNILAERKDVKLLVWTTTPWTLSANMGIAVHPELTYSVLSSPNGVVIAAKDRVSSLCDALSWSMEPIADIQGSDLVGATYLPIFGTTSSTSLKVIPASHVTADSGTGLVHCAPAHGAEDYHAFQALGLLSASNEMICHVDGEGKFAASIAEVVGEEAAKTLVSQEVLGSGSKAVVELLKQKGDALLRIQRIKHRYPYDWKTKQPIIVTATSQWFANLDGLKEDAMAALQDVQFFPSQSRNRLEAFIRSRSEWCISRQRVWGVPIPALHNTRTGRTILDRESLDHILPILAEKGVEYWWTGPVEEFLPPPLRTSSSLTSTSDANKDNGECEWKKGTDTMDVWFDSGTSWSMLPSVSATEPGRKHLADICLEGSDQHRGWFQSQLLTAMGVADQTGPKKSSSPYGTLLTHGMVLDESGRKMSKSIGNVLSPLAVIEGDKAQKIPAYGRDVLRLWVGTVDYWQDISIGPTVLRQTAETLRKIRNTVRFALGNLGTEEERRQFTPVARSDMRLVDRYVMHELHKLESTAVQGYEVYNFPRVMSAVTHLTNVTLSSLYFDITKDALYANAADDLERRTIVTVLYQILSTLKSVISPVLPHLAEEIHKTLKIGDATSEVECSSAFEKPWSLMSNEWHDSEAEREMRELLKVRSSVMGLLEKARRQENSTPLKSGLEAQVDLIFPSKDASSSPLLALLQREEEFLKTLFIVSNVSIRIQEFTDILSPQWSYTTSLPLPEHEQGLQIRVRPSTLAKCPRCWTFTRPEEDALCGRCSSVVEGLEKTAP